LYKSTTASTTAGPELVLTELVGRNTPALLQLLRQSDLGDGAWRMDTIGVQGIS
jgi:hypothetical protein